MNPKPTPEDVHIPIPRKEYKTFVELMSKNGKRRFTAREYIIEMKMAWGTYLEREANPALLTLADVYRAADMLREPVEKILGHLVRQIKDMPAEIHPITQQKKRSAPGRPPLASALAEPTSRKRALKKAADSQNEAASTQNELDSPEVVNTETPVKKRASKKSTPKKNTDQPGS